jgi:hypothetical protein
MPDQPVVQIELTSEEAAMLRDVLTAYLRNLRRERADTDRRDLRRLLLAREEFLERLLRRLEAPP